MSVTYLDIQIWANSVDQDQTASEGALWSGSTMFAIPSVFYDALLHAETTLFTYLDNCVI